MNEQSPLIKKAAIQIGIKQAFQNRDSETSRTYHTDQAKISLDTEVEQHKNYGDYVKSIVYGGLDGIITSYAVVNGVAGANLPINIVLVLGFSNLVADGMSMGVGDYLSELAEIDYVTSERAREVWEFDNYPQGEIAEMVDIYTEKGVSREDAEAIIDTMSKYRDFFIDHMLVQELGMQPPSGDESPATNGFVTMLSFMTFGVVPLISYLLFLGADAGANGLKFVVSTILTLGTLAALGAVKGKMTDTNVVKSAAFVVGNGAFAAFAAFLVGWGLSNALHINNLNG